MSAFAALALRLEARIRRLAEARAALALRARRGDPARWHHAALLWPLFPRPKDHD